MATMECRREQLTTQSSESSFDPLSLSARSCSESSEGVLAVWGFSERSLVIEEEPEWSAGFATPKSLEKWVPLSPKPQMKNETIELFTPRDDLLVDGETFYTPSSSLDAPTKSGKKKKSNRQTRRIKYDKMAQHQLAYFEKFLL